MAKLWADSNDTYATTTQAINTGLYVSGGVATATSPVPYGAGRSATLASAVAVSSTYANTTTIWFSFAHFRSSSSSAHHLTFRDGTSAQYTITIDGTTGNLLVRTGSNVGAIVGTWAGASPLSAWAHYTFRVVVNNTTGSVTGYLNGNSTPAFTVTNVNTRGGTANAWVNNHQWNNGTMNGSGKDLIVWDETGLAPNGFHGQLRSYTLVPNAAGDKTEFPTLVGAASNQAANNNATPDDDTTYVASSTVGHTDLYNLGNLPVTPTTIVGIEAYGWARKSDAGARTYALRQKSGATENNVLTDASMSTTYLRRSAWVAQNPDGAVNWTASTANGYQLGPRVEA